MVLKGFKVQGPYSEHSILFVSYEYFQQARVLDYTWPEKHPGDKHSNLSGPFVTCKENKVLWIWTLDPG